MIRQKSSANPQRPANVSLDTLGACCVTGWPGERMHDEGTPRQHQTAYGRTRIKGPCGARREGAGRCANRPTPPSNRLLFRCPSWAAPW